ncbi:MAG: DUF3341 domain-containing protein [Acidobacteriota bacterium]
MANGVTVSPRPYGVLAQFDSAGALLAACRSVRDAGYTCWDAHAPFPVHGLDEAMGLKASRVPWFVLVGGFGGAAAGMLLQWWVSTVASPLVISGKPFFSWPAFVPITFECGILGGALGAVAGLVHFSKLPRLYHALFSSRRFEAATDDGFFISVEARDPLYSVERTEEFLQGLRAVHVERVLE